MFGRKDYTGQELDDARAAVDEQLGVYRTLAQAISDETPDDKVGAALEAVETTFFNTPCSPSTAGSRTGCARSPARTATRSTRSSCSPSPS